MDASTPGHALPPAWPESFGKLLGDALPPLLLEAIASEAQAVSKSPNFWTSRDRIKDATAPITACEAAIRHLESAYMQHVLPDTWTGAEWWIQIYEHGRGLAFHFDKDEHLLSSKGQMVHPMVNSIIYLTGDSARSRLGPTVVVDQQHCSSAQQEDTPRRSLLVYPRKNNFLLFDSRLGHGVLDTLSGGLRMTLLINWWHHKPMDIQELTSDTARKHGLSLRLWPMLDGATNPCPAQQISRLSLSECDTGYVEKPQGACQDDSPAVHGTDDQPESNSRQSATNHEHEGSSGDGSSRSQHHPLSTQPAALRPSQPDAEAANGPPSQSSSSSEVQARQDDGTAALPAAKAGDPHVQVLGTGGDARGRDIRSSSGSEQLILSRGTRVPGHSWLPCPNLATPDAAESDFLTVDSLMEGCRVAVIGSGAVDAVAIQHPGFALWPMADKESQESAGLETTAAVLIPDHMLPESEGESESDSDGGSIC